MHITFSTTPNRSPRSGNPKFLVLHQTVGSYASAVSWLRNPASEASADEIISRDGENVTVLNLQRDRMKCWAVGNANSLSYNFEGEWYQSGGKTYGLLPAYYDTLAVRLIAAQKSIKAVYGVTIPLRITHSPDVSGICRHGELARWFGGSDHYTCGTAYDEAEVIAAVKRHQTRRRRTVVRVQYALEVIQDGKIVDHLTYGGGRVGTYLSGSRFAGLLKKGDVRLLRHRKGK